MRNAVQRAAFVLLSCALLLGAVKWVPEQEAPPVAALPDVYVSGGYAVSTEAAYDQRSLDYAARKLQQLYDSYLTGNDGHIYLSVIPDKGSFVPAIEGYTPASAQETADALLAQLDFVRYVDIAPGLTLEDYYRTDAHWRQEKILDVAARLAANMGVELTGSYTQKTLEKPFYGVYYGQAALPIAPEEMNYLTGGAIDTAAVYNYETDTEGGIYDAEKAAGRDPYEMFLSGSVSLLRIENPQNTSGRRLVIFRDSFGSSIAPLLVEGYSSVTLVDIRYLASSRLGGFVDFTGCDVLFLYSAGVLNNSSTLK